MIVAVKPLTTVLACLVSIEDIPVSMSIEGKVNITVYSDFVDNNN
jgi:hypothetical protein